MKAPELKSCPFCGGEAGFKYNRWNDVPLIHCGNCGALVSFTSNKRDTKKLSAELWNRRTDHDTTTA